MRDKIIDDFKKVSKSYLVENPNSQTQLTLSYYLQHGQYSKYQINKTFGSFSKAKEEAFNVVHRSTFNLKVVCKDRNKKRFFVTAIIPGGKVHEGFLASIQTYCSTNGAQLVLLPMLGVHKDAHFSDSLLELSESFATEFRFNDNLVARDFLINPQVLLPLTKLKRFGQKQESLIVASPKQHMETVRVKSSSLPHIVHSTGALSKPQYRHTTAGVLADQDHITGGLVVEVDGDKVFHIRQIQAAKDGSFYDIDKKYSPNRVEPGTATACIIGDSHAPYEDTVATNAFKEWCNTVKPDYVIFHDIFDGASISHHAENDMRRQLNRPLSSQVLEAELDTTAKYIMRWRNDVTTSTFIIVRSNHDEHLDRYLSENRFISDRFNYRISLELAGYFVDDLNPIEEWVKKRYKLTDTIWLERDDDFILEGTQLGAHGDDISLGFGGTNSMRKAEEAYGKAIIGHGHAPKIFRDVYMVGTSCLTDLGYNSGPTTSLQTSCALYPGGQRQLITCIDGTWRMT